MALQQYDRYNEWQEQFTFWSPKTVKRIILKLENNGIVLSGNYNQQKTDRTKWYTINYDKVQELIQVSSAKISRKPRNDALGQLALMDGEIQESRNDGECMLNCVNGNNLHKQTVRRCYHETVE